MGRLILVVLALAASAPAQAATQAAQGAGPVTLPIAQPAVRGVDDPRAFVEQTYAAYQRAPNDPPPDPAFAYSDRLRGLFAAYDAAYAGGDLVGALDFDWWTNAQEWQLSRVMLGEEPGGPDRKTITARFNNYDRSEISHFNFVREGGRWYLDDVVNGTGSGSDGWMLSALLRRRN
jgi:hypothetical protein